jgi:hypothetical protein
LKNSASQLPPVQISASQVHGFATLENAGGFGIPLDLNESFGWLVAMTVAGLEREAEIERA